MSGNLPQKTDEPKNLDLNEWLLFGLTAEKPIERVLSLKELAATKISAEFLPLIESIRVSDSDEDCRALAAKLLADRASEELGAQPLRKTSGHDDLSENILEQLADNEKLDLLRSIRKAPAKPFLENLRQILFNIKNPEVIEAGLNVLLRFGEATDASVAATFLGSDSPVVITAALSVIKKHQIELLKQVLPGLLASENILTRANGVRYLRNIDPEEALIHLKSLIFCEDPSTRQIGLRELLMVPLGEVENTFLQFISQETIPLLMVISGLAIACNPNPVIPEKLYDISLASRGIKQKLVTLVLKEAVRAIKDSGILTDSTESYLASLKEKLEKRKVSHLINLALRNLNHADLQIRMAAVSRLKNFGNLPQVSQALEKRAKIEANEELKFQLIACLGFQENPLDEAISSGKFATLPESEQRVFLASMKNTDSFKAAREFLKPILKKTSDRQFCIEIINLFYKWGNIADATTLLPLLKHTDPGIIASAIKTIGKISPDSLLPFLNPFLIHEDPFIKLAALEFYLGINKEDAVQYLKTILKSPQPAVRNHALGLTPFLDNACAQPILIEFFERESDPDLKRDAGYIVASNPTTDGVQAVFNQTHNEKGIIIKSLEELWEFTKSSAADVLLVDSKELERECAKRWAAKKSAQEAPEPNYSFRKISEKIKTSGQATKPRFSTSKPGFFVALWEMRWKLFTGVVFFALIFVAGFSDFSKFFQGQKKETSSSKGGGNVNQFESFSSQPGKGGLRSNIDEVFSNKTLSKTLLTAKKERSEQKALLAEKKLEYLRKLAADKNQDPIVVMNAKAELDKNLSIADSELQNGQFSAAKEAFEKLLTDKSANPVARLRANLGLSQIALKEKNHGDFNKCFDDFLQNMGSLPKCEQLKKNGRFKEKLSEMKIAGDKLRELSQNGKITVLEVDEQLKQISDFEKSFQEIELK